MTLHTTSPPPQATQSANDNGPLTSGQLKALKIAIAVMGVMIIAMLLAIVGRVLYLSANKADAPARPVATDVAPDLAPQHAFSLPAGARIEHMNLRGNRLLVRLEVNGAPRARIYDLSNGKLLSDITFADSETAER